MDFAKKQYIIIVNNLLNTSELFTYKYAIGKSNILYYKIIQDKDLLKESISNEYIIVFSWTNSTTMMYKLNKEIYIEPLSNKLIDKLSLYALPAPTSIVVSKSIS